MKRYKIILAAVVTILTLGFVTGCEEGMDEIFEINLRRCLQPLNLTAKVTNGQTVTYNWDLTKDAESFILEVYSDKDLKQKVFSETYTPNEVPVTKYMDVDMEYYFRVQARNSTKEASKWSVYDNSIKTFAVKSNLYMEVAERGANFIKLSWLADPEVDRIEYSITGSDQWNSYSITAEDKDSGSATINGLQPSNEYEMILYFSSANRGAVNVWTLPNPDGLTRVSTEAALAQGITDGANMLLTMDGSPYTIGADLAKGFDASKGFKIYGEGSLDAMPVIIGSVNITDGFDGGDIYFEGVEFNGKDGTCGFLIQHKEGSTADGIPVNSIIYKNCIISGYSKGLMYEWNKTLNIGEFTFNSCDIHNVNGDGSGGGDGFDIRNATHIDKLNFVNNTIYTSFRTFLRIDATPVIGAVVVENNTFMNLCFVDNTNNGGIFGFQVAPASFSLKNNLFLNMSGKSVLTNPAVKYIPGGDLNLSAAENYFFNVTDDFFNTNFTLAMTAGTMLDSDPCYNAKGGLYNILPSSNIAGKKIGASKWWSEYVESPEDLTMTTIEGAHTWDFSDARYFSSDFTKSKVRDFLFFGVSENKIALTDGILNFTAAATTNKRGVPTDGYIAFQVDKPGSVVIKPSDPAGLGNHFVVGVGPVGGGIAIKGGASALVDMGNAQKIVIKDITEESLVYIYPTGELSLSQLAWSNDVSEVNTSLPAPEPNANPATVKVREAKDVTITWAPVENAASYSVVFGGKTYIVEEGESYVIASSVVSMLDAGVYSVNVYANPGKNDIYNTMSAAGVAAFSVQPAGEEEESTEFVVSSVEELINAINAGKDAITLKYSSTPYELGSLTINSPIHLKGQIEGGKKSAVVGNFILSGDIRSKADYKGSVVISNLDISNDGSLSVIVEDKNDAPIVDTLALIDCDIHGTKALFDNSGKAESDAQVLIFKGNFIDNCSNGADFIDMRAGAHHTVTIVNNTFANSCRTFIRTDAGHELNYLTIRNNTFYKVATNSSSKDNNGIFHVRSAAGIGLRSYVVMNNLFYSIAIDEEPSNAAGFPKFRSKGGLNPSTVVNNYFFNCEEREERAAYSFWSYFPKEEAIAGGGAILPADPCKDAEGGDFTLTNGVAMNANVGDPRWNPMRGSIPSSEITVNNVDELLTAISAGKSTITLANGSYDLTSVDVAEVSNGKMTITNSLNLIGEERTELIGGFIFKGGVKNFTANTIMLNGNGSIDNVFEVAEADMNITSISLKNANVYNFKNRLFYMNQTSSVSSLEFFNCIFSGYGVADFTGGDFIDIRKGDVNAIKFQNNTVTKAVRTFARIDAGVGLNSMVVANNTFFNLCFVDSKDNNGIFHVRATSLNESAYIVRNNIFACMHRAVETPSQANGYPKLVSTNSASKIPTFIHNYFYDLDIEGEEYNFWTAGRVTEEVATAGYGIVLKDSPFEDAPNGNLYLTSALAASERVGDPRWNKNADRYKPGDSFEVETVVDLMLAIDAGKTNITLSGSKFDFTTAKDDAFANGVLSLSTDLTLNGKLSHGVKPTLIGAFKLLTTNGGLVLNNLNLVGVNEDESVKLGNMIDIDASANISKIVIRNCNIESYSNRFISGSGESTCGPVTITGNYVKDFGTGGDFIDFRKGSVNSIKVVSNTFVNGIRTFLRCDAAVVCGAINIENNTFYNLGAVDSKDNNGILHVRSTSATANPRQIIVKRNIFASMHREVETPTNAAAGFPHLISKASAAIAVPTIADNIFYDIDDVADYGWWMYLPEGYEGAKATVISESPFVDPSAGVFTVTGPYKGYGDLRW